MDRNGTRQQQLEVTKHSYGKERPTNGQEIILIDQQSMEQSGKLRAINGDHDHLWVNN